MKKTIFIALAIAAISTFASAEPAPQKGGTCWLVLKGSTVIASDTKLRCQHMGNVEVTVSELYEKGFRVVAMMQSARSNGEPVASLIIEERR